MPNAYLSESHGGDARWSPNRRSFGQSPQPSEKEWLEGTEEGTLQGLDNMASWKERVTGAKRLLDGRAAAWGGLGEHTWVGAWGPPRLLVLDAEIVDRAATGPFGWQRLARDFYFPLMAQQRTGMPVGQCVHPPLRQTHQTTPQRTRSPRTRSPPARSPDPVPLPASGPFDPSQIPSEGPPRPRNHPG